MTTRHLLIFLAALTLAGCGLPSATPLAGIRDYHAYGDSITAGYGLTNLTTGNYPYLFAQQHSLRLTNAAIPGLMACDIPVDEVFPADDAPVATQATMYSLLVSTNDVDRFGAGPYESTFNLCHQATIAWLAVPVSAKLRAFSSSVSSTGPTHRETANHWNALWTDAQGATLTAHLTLPATGPIYLWYRIADSSPGAFTLSLDGAPAATLTIAPPSHPIATFAGNTDSLGFYRTPAVSAGSHTVTLTQISQGSSGANFVAMGTPPASSTPPFVFVGTTPLQRYGSTARCALDDTQCQAYIADIDANIALFAADGLNVLRFDSRRYETGTAEDMTDALHPNALGQSELLHAFTDAWNLRRP